MAKKRHTAEQIISKLREAEVPPGQGHENATCLPELGVTEQTYYRWRKEYGGLRTDQAKRLKGLETENARLKKLVADQALDIQILKEVAAGNYSTKRTQAYTFSPPFARDLGMEALREDKA